MMEYVESLPRAGRLQYSMSELLFLDKCSDILGIQ